ncbi:unnamed protein product [Meloidogyne enterolobii]|uniref:Uncharacterized protein n=1 Tax=Meloidogyne enterolobii TaxID=390850 RepID=A0ACB1A5D2_MELEN
MINIEGLGHYKLEKMLGTFTNFGQCNFIVRFGENHPLKGAYSGTNISFRGFVNQQEILAKQNTKLFISHCGVNGLTESVYAGVPLICIPIGGDQHYLSSLVEHLNIGVYIKADNLGNDAGSLEEFGGHLVNALEDMIGESINQNVYQVAANKLRTKVLDDFFDNDNPWIKSIFIERLKNILGND